MTNITTGSVNQYRINGLGQRLTKAGTGYTGTLRFVYGEVGGLASGHKLIGEYDNAGALITEHVYLQDTPIAAIKAAGAYLIQADHLNTPRAILGASNALVWKWDSNAFGSTAANENPSALGTFNYNPRFPGQYYDKESALHYNYWRDSYNPKTGRYFQSDPIGLAGGINTYGYVGGNPVTKSDPRGLDPITAFMPPISFSPAPPCVCPPVPPSPPATSCDKNMDEAKKNFNPFWFYDQVKNKGPWDYKQHGNQYQAFGNFNFGATGDAFGFPSQILLRGAGAAQRSAGTSSSQWGNWYGASPYGDDPSDQAVIQQGIQYSQCNCGKKTP